MKKILACILFVATFTSCDILSQMAAPLTELDVANGLKEALIQGAQRSTGSLFGIQSNGSSAILNELLPREAQQALSIAQSLGLSNKLNQITNSVNTAALNSAEKSIPIFINSIRSMSITDAWGILRGGQDAATNYLRNVASVSLVNAIKPEIASVFATVGLKPTLLQNLGSNSPLLAPLDVDLTQALAQVITAKMFERIAQEEVRIRTDVSARTTALLQRVFAAQTAQPMR